MYHMGKAALYPDIDTPPDELKMNEPDYVLCVVGAESGFMYVGREVFDEIVARARSSNPIRERARERLISPRGVIDSQSDSIEIAFGSRVSRN